MYCKTDDSPRFCQTTNLVGDFDTVLERDHQCEKGFFSLGATCKRLAAPRCNIGLDEESSSKYICTGGTFHNPLTGVCDSIPIDLDGTITQVGRRCDGGSINRENRCSSKANLECSKYRVCEKRPKMHEKCSSNSACAWPSVCNNGVCTPFGSVRDGEYINTSNQNVCQSLRSYQFRCIPTYTSEAMPRKCYSNSDCADDGVCVRNDKNQDESGRGVCVSWAYRANINYKRCQSKRCVDTDEEHCIHKKSQCMSAFVMYQCARQCAKRPDYRFDSTYPYVFNCRSLTFTNMSSDDPAKRLCQVDEQFVNCESVFSYPLSAAPQIHSGSFAFAAIIAMIVTQIVMFVL